MVNRPIRLKDCTLKTTFWIQLQNQQEIPKHQILIKENVSEICMLNCGKKEWIFCKAPLTEKFLKTILVK